MQVSNTDDILIGTHVDSMGPRIYNIETGKVSVAQSGSNQDGPYLYVYSPDSGQNIYTMSDGEYGGNLNWFSRQQDLSYSGGDIHMYSFQMYSMRKSVLSRWFIKNLLTPTQSAADVPIVGPTELLARRGIAFGCANSWLRGSRTRHIYGTHLHCPYETSNSLLNHRKIDDTQNKPYQTTRPPARHANIATALVLSAVPAIALYASTADAQALSAAGGKANRPSIAITANGTPVVNIVAPNAAGLSHNKFTDYNVGAAGLVLNNSRTPVQTQLGGVIAGNSQLGAKPAKVILNEVIGANPTMLSGTTEIAGKSAHLIVANPNGITVNGGGFINAPRTTLTTGKAMFDSLGNIANIDTTKGRIEIQGKGLDATRIDQLDLIARSIAVNAALHAEGAKVVGVGGVTRHNLKSGTTQIGRGSRPEGRRLGAAHRRHRRLETRQHVREFDPTRRLAGRRGRERQQRPGPIAARSMPELGIDPGRINVDGQIQAGSGGASFSTGSLTVIGKTGTVSSARDLSDHGLARNEGKILARTLATREHGQQ